MKDHAKEALKHILRAAVCDVTFVKVDGTLRTLSCTLKTDLLPAVDETKPKSTFHSRPNPEVCPVFDLDAQAWKSFRYDSIRRTEFHLNHDYYRGEE